MVKKIRDMANGGIKSEQYLQWWNKIRKNFSMVE